MRLAVDGGGYATARTAFVDANQVAALHHDALTGKLSGHAAMAGDDSAAVEFAAAYDEAAEQATGALADMVDAFASLGHLTEAARANHRDANVGSVVGGAVVHDGDSLPEDGVVTVLPTTPPSVLGGTSLALPFPVGLLVDAVDGFVWPNADVDQLRDAAHTWRNAAESIEGLRSYCDAAIRGLEGQRSPEIPVAIDAITELRTAVGSVADQYAAVAGSCESYAAAVEEKRAEIIALGLEVLRVVAEEVALTVGIGLVTAGVGAAGKGALAGARLAAYAPRFAAILAALRAAGAASAATVRNGTTALRVVRSQLAKYVGVLAKRSAARGEVGALRLVARRPRGWLRQHEHSGSHTIERHVGKTDEELRARFAEPNPPRVSSTFADESTAENAIGRLLDSRTSEIDGWLSGTGQRLELIDRAETVIGRSMHTDGTITHVDGLRAVLIRDARMPEGYRILTAFPQA